MLVEYGGHVHLNRHQVQSLQALLERMRWVKRKYTAFKSKHSVSGSKEIKKEFLQEVVQIVEKEDLRMRRIYNELGSDWVEQAGLWISETQNEWKFLVLKG